jgi:hypothetical protein
MNIRGLRDDVYVLLLNTEDALAVAKYPASASFIDVSNWNRFAFLIGAGALTTATVCQVQQDTSATQTAGIKNVTGATVTIGTGDDDEAFVIEVETSRLDVKNGFRYVTLDITGPAGGDDYGAIFFLGLEPRHLPVTQPAAFPAANSVVVAG